MISSSALSIFSYRLSFSSGEISDSASFFRFSTSSFSDDVNSETCFFRDRVLSLKSSFESSFNSENSLLICSTIGMMFLTSLSYLFPKSLPNIFSRAIYLLLKVSCYSILIFIFIKEEIFFCRVIWPYFFNIFPYLSFFFFY